MRDPARSLYEELRVLERRAVATRQKAGLSASRREAAAAARRKPYSTQVDARRISSWLPEDPGSAQIPRAGDADKVWALVCVWSDWAGDRAPKRRYWMDLIEAAQPARARKNAEAATTRSAYLQQVGRIAPPELIGREEELAELTAFCLEPGRGPYVWWQARAWAGKSALLSTFVLRPPSQVGERVRIVSFFITARLAAQDTREAFIQVLLEQLAELTGRELPPVLSEATREAHLLDLLDLAAVACHGAGGRLVLVVDGLDEDRGVTTGPGAHSIAALLPADPPGGMRVIVAGRPNPPIPDDVPGWHPLRDSGIIRSLSESPYARDVERLGRQELQRLLHGNPVEQDVLGLLTAARGGLSDADLEELTGAPLGEVEDILHTVVGRTFTCRVSRWAPETGPEVYLLGHEELHTAATRYLGHRLDDYYSRLHGWADSYRAQGWPLGTPEYLLSGYYQLLVSLDDARRMVAYVGDAARHERMLDLTGGDAAALAEIRTTLDFIAAQDVPDLAGALSLACHRDLLADRNTYIPSELPTVWAALGQITRAEALATSIISPDRPAEALARVAEALAVTGQHQQAARVAGQAETVARSVASPDRPVEALARVAEAMAAAGQHQQAARIAGEAEAVALSIFNPYQQGEALARVAEAMATAGQYEDAEHVAYGIDDDHQQAEAMARVAEAMATAGLYEDAERVAYFIRDADQKPDALARVAGALAGAGAPQQARGGRHLHR